MIWPSWPPTASTCDTPRRTSSLNLSISITPGGDRALHLPDHLLDVERRHRGLIGQPADLAGHDQEAEPVLAGLLRLDRRVDREQVGLVGDLGDRRDHDVDVGRLLADHRQLRRDRRRRRGELVHRRVHLGEPLAAVLGEPRGLRATVLTPSIVESSSWLVAEISRTAAAISVVEAPKALTVASCCLLVAANSVAVDMRSIDDLLHPRHERVQAPGHLADRVEQPAGLVASGRRQLRRQVATRDLRRHIGGQLDAPGQ